VSPRNDFAFQDNLGRMTDPTIRRERSEQNPHSSPQTAGSPERELSLVDTTSIIVGIIIGAVVFQSAPKIAAALPNVGWLPSVGWLLGAWLAGGFIAWLGALCYAEWGTRCPDGGGDYHYILRAFGPRVAWVFGWMQLLVIRPGSVGFFALAFGNTAQQLVPLDVPSPWLWYSAGALAVSTLVNLCGLREGLWAQRILTTAKVLGLLLVSVVGCLVAILGKVRPLEHELPLPAPFTPAVAMILILYAYGGWNEVGYLGGEIRSVRRTIPRTLGWGLAVVTALYTLLNLAYAVGLGWERFVRSESPAAEILAIPFGTAGEAAMHGLLAVTLFGALHGSLLTGARLTATFVADTKNSIQRLGWPGTQRSSMNTGSEGPGTSDPGGSLDSSLTNVGSGSGSSLRSSPATHAPSLVLAYLVEFGISLAALLLVGREGTAEALIIFASPPFWLGLLLVGWGLLRVRQREATTAAESNIFRVPCYPWTVLLFMATCAWLTWSSLVYAHENLTDVAWGVTGVFVLGILLSLLINRNSPRH
jgi:APA family basic amino acid/polyamine antiporter